MKRKFRDMPLPQPVTHFIADVPSPRSQALHRLLLLFLVPIYSDVDACGLPPRVQHYFGHVAQTDTTVAKFTLQDRTDLVLHGLGYAVTMMAGCTSLRHDFPVVKHFRIAKKTVIRC